MLSSRDGFCTIVIFDEYLPQYHTQQQTLQLQTLAHSIGPHPPLTPVHSHSHTSSSSIPSKRSEPLSASSKEEVIQKSNASASERSSEASGTPTRARNESKDTQEQREEPPKKKRRIALTHLGAIGSQ